MSVFLFIAPTFESRMESEIKIQIFQIDPSELSEKIRCDLIVIRLVNYITWRREKKRQAHWIVPLLFEYSISSNRYWFEYTLSLNPWARTNYNIYECPHLYHVSSDNNLIRKIIIIILWLLYTAKKKRCNIISLLFFFK